MKPFQWGNYVLNIKPGAFALLPALLSKHERDLVSDGDI